MVLSSSSGGVVHENIAMRHELFPVRLQTSYANMASAIESAGANSVLVEFSAAEMDAEAAGSMRVLKVCRTTFQEKRPRGLCTVCKCP